MSVPEDKVREERILMASIVGAYNGDEQALGRYDHLDVTLHVPVLVHCVAEGSISPLHDGDAVEIIGLALEEECRHEMFGQTPWVRRILAMPVSQLTRITADEATQQAIEDGPYWVQRG